MCVLFYSISIFLLLLKHVLPLSFWPLYFVWTPSHTELALINNLEYVLQEASDVLDTLNSTQLLVQYTAPGVLLSTEEAADMRAHFQWVDMLTNYVTAVRIRLYDSDSIPEMYSALCAVNSLVNDLELTPVR